MSKSKVTFKKILEGDDYQELIATLSFEEAMQILEQLVESVELGELPLDQTVRSYERGAALIKRMQSLLDGAEKKLEVINLKRDDSDGE